MRAAARLLVGRHDFAAFRAAGCAARTTVRELFEVTLNEAGDLLYIDVRGEGFLRHMVRTLAGTLVEVGQGRRHVEAVRDLLAGGERCSAGVTAPAHGLCLMEVWY
jgi:tRNA pseudouridine38-40 synthase